jgi:hypothetical protein
MKGYEINWTPALNIQRKGPYSFEEALERVESE